MLRTILAAAASAAMLAATAGAAGAQAVPGAAAVDEYHQRFAVDSRPFDRAPRSGLIVEQALTGAPAVAETVVIEESVVMSPVPAAIPGGAAAIQSAPPAVGLTPGAPLGPSDISDRKVVAGEAAASGIGMR